MIEDIIASIQGLGGDLADYSGGLAGLTGISGQDFDTALSTLYNIDNTGALTAGMFPGIGQSQVDALLGRTYSPLIETKGQGFLNEMLSAVRKGGAKASGGFAGSGQEQRFQQNVRDVYGKQMTDVLSGIGSSKAKASQNIQDTIDAYRQIALQMAPGV